MIIRMMHDVNGYRVKIETVEASIIFATFSIFFFYFQDLDKILNRYKELRQ